MMKESAFLAVVACVMFLGCENNSEDESAGGEKVERSDFREKVRTGDLGATTIVKEVTKTNKSVRRSVDLVGSWDEMVLQSTRGSDVGTKRIEWATGAIAGAGSATELEAILAFLHERNEGDLLEWVYTEGLKSPFSDERAPAMRDWLAGLGPEDKLMAKKVGVAAGFGFAGDEEGLNAYFGQVADKGVIGSVLGGYCAAWVADHPEEAVSKFMSLRPKGVDPTGLVQVMQSLPATSNFAVSGGKIPPDRQKGASKVVRTALLENWAAVRPQEAASYVVGNTRTVDPDQLEVVMASWMETDPEGAAAWGEGLETGVYRDHVLTAEAERFRKEDVGRAWEAVGKIGDLDQKIVAAKQVYEIWSNRDPDGAVQAWEVMFADQQ